MAQLRLHFRRPHVTAAATPIGTEFLVNTQTTGDQVTPAVASLAGGGYVICWEDHGGTLGDDDGPSVKAQVYAADGTKLGGEFLVNTQVHGEEGRPSVIGLADGGFIVAWHDYSSAEPNGDIVARIFDAGGTPVTSEISVADGTTSQRWPAMTQLADGTVVVAWEEWTSAYGDTSGRRDIVAQMLDSDGARIGGPFRLNPENVGDEAWPQLAALAGGGFVATWQVSDAAPGTSDFGHVNVVAQIFEFDGAAVGEPIVVGTDTTGDQGNARVAALADGGFVIAWTDTRGTEQDWEADCLAQVYSADGALVGAQITVSANQGAGLNEWSEAVTALQDGGFLVGWMGAMPGDSSWHAVGAQVFSATGSKVGDAFRVNTSTTDDQYHSAFATLADGRIVATWQDESLTLGDSSGDAIKGQLLAVSSTVNAAPVITSNGGAATAAISLAENIAAVTRVTASDSNVDSALAYSISGGADAALFSINATTGALRFKAAPNFERPADSDANGVYEVQVTVSDGALTDAQTLSVTVTNVNEAPTGGVRVSGTATVGATLSATHTVTDPDGAGSGHFQWLRDGVAISGATSASYLVGAADKGHAIAASLVYVDGGGFSNTVSSAPQIVSARDPGVTITGTDRATGENGDTAVFSVVLDKAPVDPVTLTFSVTDASEGRTSVQSLTFTAANWNVAQTLTVTGLDDYLNDGDQVYALRTGVDTRDLSYARVTVADVALTNVDDGRDVPRNLYGNNDIDYLVGGDGDDRLYGGGNMDDLRGGIGNDRLYGQEDNDRLYGGLGADELYGGYDDDELNGDAGNDKLYGEAGTDRLQGGIGNDVLDGGTGADVMIGGAGNDTYYVDDSGDVIDDQGLAGDVDTVLVLATIQYTLAANVENATLGGDSGSSSLAGNGLANTLTGNDSANTLAGGGGNDVLAGGGGNDALSGGAGVDTADFTDAAGNVTVDLGAGRAAGEGTDTLSGIENVTVGGGDDVVVGSDAANALAGGDGNDSLTGGGGNDVLVGGTGDDTLYAGSGNDSVDAGAGDDVIVGGSGAGDDTYVGGTGVDTIRYTSARAGILVDLSVARDQARSVGSTDAAGIGTDQLSGIENVIGGNYADTLKGNGAANWLYGMGGKDVLTGGAGADRFVFDTAPSSANCDTITDFSRTQGDRIVLDTSVFNALATTGALGTAQFYAAAGAKAAHDADDRVVYDSTTGALYYDADGQGGQAAVQFATIGQSVHPGLAASDFLVVA